MTESNSPGRQDYQSCSIFPKPQEFLLEEEPSNVQPRAKCPETHIQIFDIDVVALIDSGSEISAISTELLNKIKLQYDIPILPVVGISILGALGKRSKKITQQAIIKIKMDDFECDVVCLIVQDLVRDLILGTD